VSDSSAPEGSLPPELAREMEAICDRFERAWHSDTPPHIEDFVAEAPEGLRAALLRELVLLEIHYRRAQGKSCELSEYLQCFPNLETGWLGQAIAGVDAAGTETPPLAQQQPQGGAAPLTVSVPPEAIGSRIGPYKLLQKLGEGGMGVVYMAEQQQPVKRRVALKIIKAGLDSAQVVARFEQERQALAMMDHPNIAKVLDAGAIGIRGQESGVTTRLVNL